MHVLRLPFGMALALVPRHEADRLQRRELVRPLLRNTVSSRDKILGDLRNLNRGGHC
ncbi:hypothetical protein BH18ACT12_BH18ACT12_12630 [soil metagenome]